MNAEVLQLLTERGSLTRRMQSILGYPPRLRCTAQGFARPFREESALLGIAPRSYALVREIFMGSHDSDWLFARTIVPRQTLQGAGRRIRLLKNQPLGVKLFGRMGADRSQLNVFYAPLSNPKIARQLGVGDDALWQRQSIFMIEQSPILIEEVFLPQCPLYPLLANC